jgi:hypothetical protein
MSAILHSVRCVTICGGADIVVAATGCDVTTQL